MTYHDIFMQSIREFNYFKDIKFFCFALFAKDFIAAYLEMHYCPLTSKLR